MCAHSDQIDRLAAFCRLEEKGYHRDPDDGWVLDVPGGIQVWQPWESDDDFRKVLERFHEVSSWHQRWTFVKTIAEITIASEAAMTGDVFAAMLATPAEKCEAVLRVLEASE